MSTTPRPTRAALTALPALAALATLALAACGGDDGGSATPQTFTLTITPTGSGSGRVLSAPAGIDCQITNGVVAATGCTASFPAGTSVGLVASPGASNLEFIGWGAPCAEAAACTVTVSANTTLGAGFRARVQTLTLSLQAPARDDGAILLTLTGPSILAVRPGAGLELAESRDVVTGGAARSRVLLRGTIAAGAILQVDVPGSATAAQYQATVQQVAARASGGYALRTDPAAYVLSLR